MKAKLFSIYSLLAIVMMLAGTTVSQAETITWNSSNVFNQEHGALELYSGDDPLTFEGVSISITGSGSSFFTPYRMTQEGGFGDMMLYGFEGASFTFTAPTGKKFTKIEITNNDNILDLGDANWSAQDNQVVWSGTPSNTVTLAGNDLTAIQRITSIVFTLEEPASTTGYKVALAEDTEDADNWTIAPAAATTTGVAAGTSVKAKYSGTKKVKSVKAVKKAPATITVTWNNNDITGSGNSFTKDGVTITASMIYFDYKDFYYGGTFTTTLGNFTKIEVTTGGWNASGTGWSGSINTGTWTGNASSVSFIGNIMGVGMGTTKFVFTIEPTNAAAYTMAANATAGDVGKLICTDGHIHAYNADAACTKSRVAKIIYVGSSTGDATYNHGLALALTDESSSGMDWNNAKTACTNKNTSATVKSASWMLPSRTQWETMGATRSTYTTLRDGFTSVGGSNLESDDYWSSTEYEDYLNYAWLFDFGGGGWNVYPKDYYYPLVRACLAF